TVGGHLFWITYAGGDGNDVVLTAGPVPPPPPPPQPFAVSGRLDGTVALYLPNSSGQYGATPVANLAPFGGFAGSVRTAVADVNGDTIPDTILITGPGTPIRFAVVSGTDNTTLLVPPTAPFAGSEGFTGGGFVAAADLDHDGRAEMIFCPDQGGGPRVTIFSLVGSTATVKANFFGIDDPNFRGGARPAVGDVNHDGTPDLAVAAGFLGGPRTALFNGTTLFATPVRLVGDFFAFPGDDATRLRNGVFVSIGDINGDGFADLIFAGGPGGAPRVFVLSGQQVSAGNVTGAQASPVANFFVAGNSADRGGVRVAAKNADGDAKADLAVGSGEGSPAKVRIYLGKNFTSSVEPTAFQDISVFGGAPLPGGVFVG
ncbi:MAG TPA: VCBS repeat-containing protein, partial [Gemmataceae bacterium]|nr:VCBS repeat-containing protein [Gemmataceae bacterium]